MFDDEVLKTLRGTIQPEFEAYSNIYLAIFKPKYFVYEENQLNDYHFVIPKAKIPGMIVDKKMMSIQDKHIFSTNPDQTVKVSKSDGINCTHDYVRYVSLFIDKQKLQEFSKDAFNKSEVCFDNKNHYLSNSLASLINVFEDECRDKQAGFRFILDSIAMQISINILRDLKSNLPYFQEKRKYSSRIEINKAIDYLWENKDMNFCLENLCKVANLSPYYFLRLFKNTTGKTPYEYYMEIKINKAFELFRTGKYSITEVSHMLGFSSHSHFSSIFRKKMGITPSAFIKSIK